MAAPVAGTGRATRANHAAARAAPFGANPHGKQLLPIADGLKSRLFAAAHPALRNAAALPGKTCAKSRILIAIGRQGAFDCHEPVVNT